MKIKVLKTFHDEKLGRRVRPGETITVAADRGRDLIRNLLGTEAAEPQKGADKPKAETKPDAKADSKADPKADSKAEGAQAQK